jgi:cytochrome P450 family 130
MVHAEFDPLEPAFQVDPYPGYAWLRDHEPVHHHPGDHRAPAFWALSRFEDVWQAVRRPEIFSSASGLTFFRDEIGQLGLPPTIVMLDPPVQTRLRALIGRGFTPRRVQHLEDRLRTFVRERIHATTQAGVEGAPVDLHTDFSGTIPTWVLAELFGLPEADRERFGPWVQTLTRLQNDGFDTGSLMDGPSGSSGSEAAAGVAAVGEMFEYFSAAIAAARKDPGDDLLGALVSAEIDGERLSDWDILGFCFVVVAGGADTTASLISHTVLLTGEDMTQRELLLADPTLVPDALVECLRLESSVQGLARTTLENVQVDGVEIPAGEKVLMLYGSANRDPREFGETADRLDVRRQVQRHLAFSSGPHFCIGNHLARLQARVAIEELFAAHPHITVDRDSGQRHVSAFVRGWLSLPAHGLELTSSW